MGDLADLWGVGGRQKYSKAQQVDHYTFCPECGWQLTGKFTTCPRCGADLRIIRCPYCGGAVPAKIGVCPRCTGPIS